VLLLALMMLALAGCAGAKDNDVAPSGAAQTESAGAIASGGASEAASPSPSEPVPSVSAEPEAEELTPQASASPSAPASASTAESPSPSATPKPSPSPTPSKPAESATEKPAASEIVFSIIGNKEWGTIVDGEQVQLKDGDTASSVLKRVAKAHRLAYEIRGSGAMTYVEGIDGLYEFDDGPTSGWKYRVNGVVPDIGAGVYKLKPGDRLEWYYVTEDDAAAAAGEESAP
jgi:hypothetical protein